jgi:Domain of unknown function (DUF4132)
MAGTKAEASAPESDGLHWVTASDGYELTLDGTKLKCRNAKGKVLSSVPAALKDHEVAIDLRGLSEWLAGHEKQCRARVDAWMLRSLPIPTALIGSVWSDPSWNDALRDCVVVASTDDGHDFSKIGLLRAASADGVGVVNLDGETVHLACDRIAVVHPVLIDELDDWREFSAELQITQVVPQLFRETHVRPDLEDKPVSVNTFSDGKFEQLRFALGRASSNGFGVSGGYVTCRVWEDGRFVEARYWVGSDSPDAESYTGDLVWVDEEGSSLHGPAIGRVAYSEGMRMAAIMYAGRKIDEKPEDNA